MISRRPAAAVAALATAAAVACAGVGAGVAGGPAGPAFAVAGDCALVASKSGIVRRRAARGHSRRRVLRWRHRASCGPAPGPDPTPLGVAARDATDPLCYGPEMCLRPTRSSVPAGPVTVELDNQGEDPHTLRIQRVGGPEIFAIPADYSELPPGGTSRRTVTLIAGSWRLFCSISDHESRGMVAGLTVD